MLVFYLGTDGADQLVVASLPRSIVEFRAEIFGKEIQQFLAEVGEVLRLETTWLVLFVEVSQLSFDGFWVIEKADGHRQTSKNTFSVGLELRRVNVVAMNTFEDGTCFGVIVEQLVEQFDTELDSVVTRAERLLPLMLNLEALQSIAVSSGCVRNAHGQNNSKYQLHDVSFTSGRSCRY